MNSEYRRLLKRIPKELSGVLENLSANWTLLSYRPGGPGWSADIEIKGRKFRLNSEYKYIGAEEILEASFRSLLPPGDKRISISPEQVATLINKEIA